MVKEFVLAFMLALIAGSALAEPEAAKPFKRTLIREVQMEYGLGGPVALMAAQIEQESGWRPSVCSSYACGLSQFTPATEDWIKTAYPKKLNSDGVFNPGWAIRAMVIYDRHIYHRIDNSATDCDRWAFTLSAYNGGPGWVNRDRAKCSNTKGCDPGRWVNHVALHSNRAAWAFKENRAYPKKIFAKQVNYEAWGRGVECAA